MTLWNWVILQLVAQVFVGVFHWRLVGKGRLLTRPLYRFRFFRPLRDPYTGRLVYSSVRLKQLAVLVVAQIGALIFGLGSHSHLIAPISVCVVIGLYLDDYFTGDDDRWKRFKDRIRNAVRWRMHLPAPSPEGAR